MTGLTQLLGNVPPAGLISSEVLASIGVVSFLSAAEDITRLVLRRAQQRMRGRRWYSRRFAAIVAAEPDFQAGYRGGPWWVPLADAAAWLTVLPLRVTGRVLRLAPQATEAASVRRGRGNGERA